MWLCWEWYNSKSSTCLEKGEQQLGQIPFQTFKLNHTQGKVSSQRSWTSLASASPTKWWRSLDYCKCKGIKFEHTLRYYFLQDKTRKLPDPFEFTNNMTIIKLRKIIPPRWEEIQSYHQIKIQESLTCRNFYFVLSLEFHPVLEQGRKHVIEKTVKKFLEK